MKQFYIVGLFTLENSNFFVQDVTSDATFNHGSIIALFSFIYPWLFILVNFVASKWNLTFRYPFSSLRKYYSFQISYLPFKFMK